MNRWRVRAVVAGEVDAAKEPTMTEPMKTRRPVLIAVVAVVVLIGLVVLLIALVGGGGGAGTGDGGGFGY